MKKILKVIIILILGAWFLKCCGKDIREKVWHLPNMAQAAREVKQDIRNAQPLVYEYEGVKYYKTYNSDSTITYVSKSGETLDYWNKTSDGLVDKMKNKVSQVKTIFENE